MTLPIFVVDAFTSRAFGGNPAAVVLGHGEPAWMQSVAAEMRHAETAFVRPRAGGGYDLRWFSPEVEVDLCGHATLASAHVLWETDRVDHAEFHTRGGVLGATHDAAGTITLDFPIAEPVPEVPMPALDAALGISPVDFLRTDGQFFMCVVADETIVRKCAPDLAQLRTLGDVRGVYVTAAARAGSDHDIVSRCFAPRIGINEDSVTGSMHCVLAAYWCPRLGTDELHAYQASARGGEMTVVRKGDRALLTGHATTVLAGELHA